MDETLLRRLTPAVIGILVRRGADFAAAEDAVQDSLVEAVRVWPGGPPQDPKGWLVTVAWRKFLDAARADTSRRHREARVEVEPVPGPGELVDDTLQLYFLCAHPSLTPASAVALTLRAVGGLTTRQIAQAYLVPEATMAQRISRAVAVGEADGPRAGLAALAGLDPALPRHAAVAAYLYERDGDPVTAARLYSEAARSAPSLPERDHLTRQAARLNAQLRG
ncbi:sigma factor [Microtetraspora malaysiensis]|uniref:sigma factor n=1 Tax=Microtetraspora malaysiensis TaxID=161358 RepID=UPI003D8D567A